MNQVTSPSAMCSQIRCRSSAGVGWREANGLDTAACRVCAVPIADRLCRCSIKRQVVVATSVGCAGL